MYSLYKALKYIYENNLSPDNIFILNGDVIVSKELMKDASSFKQSRIFIDKSIYLEGSMKITVKDGLITDISKNILREKAYAVSIDLYKFEYLQAKKLFSIINNFITAGILDKWTEFAIQKGVKEGKLILYPGDITGHVWWEIDDFIDLKHAEYRFKLYKNIELIAKKKYSFLI